MIFFQLFCCASVVLYPGQSELSSINSMSKQGLRTGMRSESLADEPGDEAVRFRLDFLKALSDEQIWQKFATASVPPKIRT